MDDSAYNSIDLNGEDITQRIQLPRALFGFETIISLVLLFGSIIIIITTVVLLLPIPSILLTGGIVTALSLSAAAVFFRTTLILSPDKVTVSYSIGPVRFNVVRQLEELRRLDILQGLSTHPIMKKIYNDINGPVTVRLGRVDLVAIFVTQDDLVIAHALPRLFTLELAKIIMDYYCSQAQVSPDYFTVSSIKLKQYDVYDCLDSGLNYKSPTSSILMNHGDGYIDLKIDRSYSKDLIFSGTKAILLFAFPSFGLFIMGLIFLNKWRFTRWDSLVPLFFILFFICVLIYLWISVKWLCMKSYLKFSVTDLNVCTRYNNETTEAILPWENLGASLVEPIQIPGLQERDCIGYCIVLYLLDGSICTIFKVGELDSLKWVCGTINQFIFQNVDRKSLINDAINLSKN